MQIVTTRVAIVAEDGDNPVFGESVTEVILSDDAAGFFITLSQSCNPEAINGEVRLSIGELEAALDIAVKLITGAESKMNGETE